MTVYEKRMKDVREAFVEAMKDHKLTALDEGAGMRRLVVQKPGTWVHGFTVTTWPNYLAITGDLGAAVFTRLPDMFEFFRQGSSDTGSGINPGYWEEKVVAIGKQGAWEFDAEVLRESVRDYYVDNPEMQQKALEALEGAEGIGFTEQDCLRALEAVDVRDAWDFGHEVPTHTFLWLCHAIVLAVRLYDERKEVTQNLPQPRLGGRNPEPLSAPSTPPPMVRK